MTGFPHNRLHGCVESNVVVLLSSQRRNKTSFSKRKMFVELIWKKQQKTRFKGNVPLLVLKVDDEWSRRAINQISGIF